MQVSCRAFVGTRERRFAVSVHCAHFRVLAAIETPAPTSGVRLRAGTAQVQNLALPTRSGKLVLRPSGPSRSGQDSIGGTLNVPQSTTTRSIPHPEPFLFECRGGRLVPFSGDGGGFGGGEEHDIQIEKVRDRGWPV
jgi:hypothetical protein